MSPSYYLEDFFYLTYGDLSLNVTFRDILEMPASERRYLVERLKEQRSKDIKKAT